MSLIAFYVFGGVVVLSALGVAFSASLVRSAVGVLCALIGLAGVYVVLSAQVLAAIQVFLAVAGGGVLMLFGLALRGEDRERVGKWRGVGAWVVGGLVSAGMLFVTLTTPWAGLAGTAGGGREDLAGALVDPNGYLVIFELVGLLVLAVVIGVAHLASPEWSGGESLPRRPFDER